MKLRLLSYIFLLIPGIAVLLLFGTELAENSIDILSFIAGGFLVTEGAWKIFSSPRDNWRLQADRCVRIGLGVCIFTIHLLQYMDKVS